MVKLHFIWTVWRQFVWANNFVPRASRLTFLFRTILALLTSLYRILQVTKNQLRDWSNLEMEIILNEQPLILLRTPVAHFLEWTYFRQPQLRINPLNGPKLLWQGWPKKEFWCHVKKNFKISYWSLRLPRWFSMMIGDKVVRRSRALSAFSVFTYLNEWRRMLNAKPSFQSVVRLLMCTLLFLLLIIEIENLNHYLDR